MSSNSTSKHQTTASRLSRSRNTETLGAFRSPPTNGVVSSVRHTTLSSSIRGRSTTSSTSSTRTSMSTVGSRTLSRPAVTSMSSARTTTTMSTERAGLRNGRGVTESGERRRTSVTMTTSLGVGRQNAYSSIKVQPRRSARLQSSPIKENEEKELAMALKTLPSINHQKCSGRSSPGENVFYCPICFENIKNTGGRTAVLPCGHVFCRDCLLAIFQKKKKCPLCQVSFQDSTAIMEIFF